MNTSTCVVARTIKEFSDRDRLFLRCLNRRTLLNRSLLCRNCLNPNLHRRVFGSPQTTHEVTGKARAILYSVRCAQEGILH